MSPAIDPIYEEAVDALFRIVRQSILGRAMRDGDMTAAKSVIRRMDPERYKVLVARRAQLAAEGDSSDDGPEETLP
jgi:hypothetical protein